MFKGLTEGVSTADLRVDCNVLKAGGISSGSTAFPEFAFRRYKLNKYI